jgi:hypothetical protein
VTPSAPAIERFARETLGCQCPAAVFERIEIDDGPPPGCPEVQRRILVGGRLLIYLIAGVNTEAARERIGPWVQAGLGERERRGLTRLRLAVALDDLHPRAMPALDDAFRALPELAESTAGGADPCIHLHCIPRDALSTLLGGTDEP